MTSRMRHNAIMNGMQGKRTLLIIALLAAAAIASVFVGSVHAQTSQPQFLLTWSATNSYVPPGYAGKILPNQESQITASLEVIANGKPVNLSGNTIYWYQNQNLMGGGIGVQHFTFPPYGEAPNTVDLEIQIPDYPTGLLIHDVEIPVVKAQAIIAAPYPSGNFSGIPATVTAEPYFFATTSTDPLSFSWSVNGETVTSAENPQTLQISLPQSTPSGFAVAVNLTVQDSNDGATSLGTANLTYQPKP